VVKIILPTSASPVLDPLFRAYPARGSMGYGLHFEIEPWIELCMRKLFRPLLKFRMCEKRKSLTPLRSDTNPF